MSVVYVLSNPTMQGLVKVGHASNISDRIYQLSSATGVPLPFKLEHAVESVVAEYDEETAHLWLNPWRVSVSREFFKCDISLAVEAVDLAVNYRLMGLRLSDASSRFIGKNWNDRPALNWRTSVYHTDGHAEVSR